MLRLYFTLMCVLVSAVIYGQQKEFTPQDTEVWEPVPPVVTPGDRDSEPPEDAIVLFDGSGLDHWDVPEGSSWKVQDQILTIEPSASQLEHPVNIRSKQSFGDMQMHIEWKSPEVIEGEGQRRGNSGIFIQSRYELQIQDCYNNPTYVNGQAGAIYKQSAPLVNACRPPGEWQSFDIYYTAPRFDDIGLLLKPGYITVVHNGVLIQNHTEIKGIIKNVGLPHYEPHEKAPLMLQDHGNPVSFRNIWVREL